MNVNNKKTLSCGIEATQLSVEQCGIGKPIYELGLSVKAIVQPMIDKREAR